MFAPVSKCRCQNSKLWALLGYPGSFPWTTMLSDQSKQKGLNVSPRAVWLWASIWLSSCFPSGSVVKNLPANAEDPGDVGSIPGLGRPPGGGNGNTLQYSYLENLMDRRAGKAIVHGVAKSQTWLSDWTCIHAWLIACIWHGNTHANQAARPRTRWRQGRYLGAKVKEGLPLRVVHEESLHTAHGGQFLVRLWGPSKWVSY